MHNLITNEHVESFQRDGVVLIKGLFADYVDIIRSGIEHNMSNPGPYAAENLKEGEDGRFFDDYCNWTRIVEFKEVIWNSPAAEVAANLMKSKKAQVFHDHVLVKEPGTAKKTPWHQDGPYYFIDGIQNVSLWSPMDTVTEASLRCVAGSHLWDKPVLPTRWLSETNFYREASRSAPPTSSWHTRISITSPAISPTRTTTSCSTGSTTRRPSRRAYTPSETPCTTWPEE